MSTLADDMVNGLNLLTIKKNKFDGLEKTAKVLKALPLPIAAEIMDALVAKKIDENNGGLYCITLSYLTGLVGTFNPNNAEQRIKNMLLAKKNIDLLANMDKDNIYTPLHYPKCYVPLAVIKSYAQHYFAQLQGIRFLSDRYQANYAKTRHKGRYTREYLDRIRVSLFELRNIENQIYYSLGPYTWLVRGNLFTYPDPAKKFVTIYRGKKTEHSYERDWLPL